MLAACISNQTLRITALHAPPYYVVRTPASSYAHGSCVCAWCFALMMPACLHVTIWLLTGAMQLLRFHAYCFKVAETGVLLCKQAVS